MQGKETSPFRSGFVALVGRPNAGKSSLVNALMGQKIAITSPTAQTTRQRFCAVLHRSHSQIVFVDTPGLHKPHDMLGEELNASALHVLDDVDLVVFVLDVSKAAGRGDAWVCAQLAHSSARKIAVLSKMDLASPEQLASQRRALHELGEWEACFELSSRSGQGLDEFICAVEALLPPGPQWFPADMKSDQPIEFVIAEFVREKILRDFSDEIPHAVGVIVDDFEYDAKKKLHRIFASIFVERESQKAMIIGARGSAIKRIGTEARASLEQLLGTRVFLDLRVKVKRHWRRDVTQIRRFGYGEQ